VQLARPFDRAVGLSMFPAMPIPPLSLIAVCAVLALWWFTRTGELFCISVRHGKVLVVRGRVPAGLLQDIAKMMTSPTVKRATIRGLKTEHGGRIVFSGQIDEGRQQRIRNVFGLYPAAKLQKAPAIARPTIGQLAGIAWLAWLFDRR
jgi:hypothetical protein